MRKILFEQEGIFASHPANHGRWQFGSECLFGFLTGERGDGAYHNILPPYKKLLMRSLDAGRSWTLEEPNVDFEGRSIVDGKPDIRPETIFRVCGSYDTGGEYAVPQGCYYTSNDRGKTWEGPYEFTGVNSMFTRGLLNTSRTCQLDNILFISERFEKRWGSDNVHCIQFDGNEWKSLSTVCKDGSRAVMPSVTRLDENKVMCALRRKGVGGFDNAVQLFLSKDNCKTWIGSPTAIFTTGRVNGNPPAMHSIGDNVYCCFANRSTHNIMCAISINGGKEWRLEVIDEKVGKDIGYPVMFGDETTGPSCIYYSDGKIVQRNF